MGAAVLALAVTGCPPPMPQVAPVPSPGKVRMRVFTETAPVRLIAAAGGVVFVAKDHGLERWTGKDVLLLKGTHGLIGDRVLGIAADARRNWLWTLTDGGLGYYDIGSGGFVELPPSTVAASVGLGGDRSVKPPESLAVAAAVDGGVWVGHARGLHHVSPDGWRATDIHDPVTALHLDDAGNLWIGTTRGLRHRRPDGSVVSIARPQGCDVVQVRAIAGAPEGGVLVLGADASGTLRLAGGSGATWWTYALPDGAPWTALAGLGDRTVALAGDALYAITRPGAASARTSAPLELVSTATPGPAPILRVEKAEAQPPAGATTLAVDGDRLLIGTREVGVARFALDAAQPQGWLRRAEMLDAAGTLGVHCLAADDCWIATGAPRAWRWRGDGFEPAGPPEGVVLAVTRDSAGVLYGLHRTSDHTGIEIARIDGERWEPLGVVLKTPGTRPEVSFARFAPDGLLWVGLRYHDEEDSLQPWGVALVDVSLGAVAYHHASGDRRDRARGILPVPVGVLDVGFLGQDQVWMASHEGAVRMRGEAVEVWNEGADLESELLDAVAVSPGGLVFVASPEGVGTYDGERWRFPPELRGNVRDLALGADGRLWLATDRGIAIYDGGALKRIDVRRGLVENEILDVTLDELGRVWARGPTSLTLITP